MRQQLAIILMALFVLFGPVMLFAQQKKPAKQPTKENDMNKLLEEAMKQEGMSKDEQEEMKKMMKGVMPALQEQNKNTADYPDFSDNKKLLTSAPATFNKKALTSSEIQGYANTLFAKLLAKGEPAEMALVKKIIAQTPGANDVSTAAVVAMMQGHPQAAMALSMYAVKTEPLNQNWQNNMAALLTQYGYPDLALPLLMKLGNELPYNSSVLNNLANAWLGVGRHDSAITYARSASRTNPAHPEAAQVEGLIGESKGLDPAKHYARAMANAPNPFTQQMIKNAKSNVQLTWDDIKKNLTIFEYFPNDWLRIPELNNSVMRFQDDVAIQKAYAKVAGEIEEKVELMIEQTQKELDALSDQGEDAFAKEMMEVATKGLSWMSKPATNVLEVLHSFQTKNQLAFADTIIKIENWKADLKEQKNKKISAIYKKIEDSKNTSCVQYKQELDRLENEYLGEVNTRIRKVMVRHIQDYRQWLNAWITWSWYVAGNVKNVLMMQDLQATAHLAGMYKQAAQLMETTPAHCVSPVKEVTHQQTTPDIPNFTCPAVVSIPSGADWQQLTAEAKNFNNNIYKIAQAPRAVPNVSVAYGINQVAQPGIAPFIKTANGSVMPGAVTKAPGENDDDYLAPIEKIPEPQRMSADDYARSVTARALMEYMLSGDCKRVKSDKQNWEEGLARILIFDRIWKSVHLGMTREQVKKEYEENTKTKYPTVKSDAFRYKLQPTINSGLQSQTNFNLSKDLFK